MVTALPIATIVVFAILSLPVFYCCFKHGKGGLLAWGVLQSFCIIRIIGGILEIRNETTGEDVTAALIVANIGLSPMILSTLGVLHEARVNRDPAINTSKEWKRFNAFHSIVITATILLIVGIVNQIDDNSTQPNATRKAGAIIFLLAALFLTSWIFISFRQTERRGVPTWRDATILLGSAALVVPLVLLRSAYVMIVTFVTNSWVQHSTTLKICLSTVPEMLLVAILAVNGVRTRNIKAKKNTRGYGHEMVGGVQESGVERGYGK